MGVFVQGLKWNLGGVELHHIARFGDYRPSGGREKWGVPKNFDPQYFGPLGGGAKNFGTFQIWSTPSTTSANGIPEYGRQVRQTCTNVSSRNPMWT